MTLLAELPFPVFYRDLAHQQTINAHLAALQKFYDFNPNIILYAVWYALQEQGRLRRPEFKKLIAALHPWQERVSKALQQLAMTPYSREIKVWVELELDVANQFARQMLAQALPADKQQRRNNNQRLQDAAHNLLTYYRIMRVVVKVDLCSDTGKILRLIFEDAEDQQIYKSVEEAFKATYVEEPSYLQYSLV